MNKAGKHIHIQSGAILSPSRSGSGSFGSVGGNMLPTSPPQKNVITSIMSFLPDNRPITSLQIVEEYEKCPKNFTSVHRTYDQDSDADLWRETTILFGRQTTRYLCLSKTEGLPEYVVETLRVISEKEHPPKEFSLLSRTADTEQKAWRKRQIAYKLSKRGAVTQAVTDIILCSKLKSAPEGFKLAGDINGILVCYKTGSIRVRIPPPVPLQLPICASHTPYTNNNSEVEKALNRLNLNNWNQNHQIKSAQLPSVPTPTEHDYEEIQASYQISPMRPAPRPPVVNSNSPDIPISTPSSSLLSNALLSSSSYGGTLGAYSELDGVPFVINPSLIKSTLFDIPTLPPFTDLSEFEYDFQLERQLLCTIKSSASKNPFFQ